MANRLLKHHHSLTHALGLWWGMGRWPPSSTSLCPEQYFGVLLKSISHSHLNLQTSSPGVPQSSSIPIAQRVSPQCLILNALVSSQDVPNPSFSPLSKKKLRLGTAQWTRRQPVPSPDKGGLNVGPATSQVKPCGFKNDYFQNPTQILSP